jgi:arsenate reductase
MEPKKILFVCIHNSARSQMAEAFLNRDGHGKFSAESAGIKPSFINPIVVEAMRDDGIDLSGKPTRGVKDILKAGKSYDYVITVCDEAGGEACPVFPGGGARIHWNFEDPSSFQGTFVEKLKKTMVVRDQIRDKVGEFIRDSGSAC